MKLKKIFSLAIAGALACVLFTGCLTDMYEYAGTINGQQIPSGLYLAAQHSNYRSAKNKVEDPKKDVLKQKIDGESAKKWIERETEEYLKLYVCVEQICFEEGIVLTDENRSYIEQMASSWQSSAALYAANGIGNISLAKVAVNGMLMEQLFTDLYGEGGERAPDDKDLRARYEEANAHLRYIMVPKYEAAEGEDDKLDITRAVADDILAAVKSGKTFEEAGNKHLESAYEAAGKTFDDDTVAAAITTSYLPYEPGDYETYSEEFLTALKGQKVGDFGTVELARNILVYEKIENFADDEAFENMRASVLRDVCYGEFEDYLRDIYDEYPVEWKSGARWYMRPGKIKEEDDL